ncbi:MAG: ArnT family glycosyltransferase [Candidatus Omnitrophota bacterium]
MNREIYKKIGLALILLVILALGFMIRFRGIPFGLPLETHPDEPRIVSSALRIAKTGNLNPHFLNYPSMYFYMQAALYKATISQSDTPIKDIRPLLFLRGRIMTVLISVGTLIAVFILCRILFGPIAALAATAFLAFSSNHIANSFLITVDSPMTFWVVMSALMSALILTRGPKWSFYILNAIFIGFAIGSKYTAVFAGLPLLFAHLSVNAFSFKKIINWKGIIAVPLIVAAFLFTTPYSVLDHHQFFQALHIVGSIYSAGNPGVGTSHFSYGKYFSMLIDGFGTLPLLFSLAGLLLLFFYPKKKDWNAGFFVFTFPLFFFPFIGAFPYCFMRTLMPILPFLAILAGFCVSVLWDMGISSHSASPASGPGRVNRAWMIPVAVLGMGVAIFGIALQGQKALAYVHQVTLPDTRATCKVWIEENLTPGSRIVRDFYTPPLDKKTFKVTRLGIASLMKVKDFSDYDYVLTSDFDYGRFFAEESKYPDQVEAYKKIFTYPLIKAFQSDGVHDSGPYLRLFRVTNP